MYFIVVADIYIYCPAVLCLEEKYGRIKLANQPLQGFCSGSHLANCEMCISYGKTLVLSPIGSMVLLYMVTFTYIYHPYTPFMFAYIQKKHGSVMGLVCFRSLVSLVSRILFFPVAMAIMILKKCRPRLDSTVLL